MNKIEIKHPPGSGILHILQVGLRESDMDHELVDGPTVEIFFVSDIGGKADQVIVADWQDTPVPVQNELLHRLKEVGTGTVILLSTE